jgi:EAL domain-containing protein (putative c-di-GMP-specific phosphodiesterase class I)/GGDEF domain-containing protein
MSIKRQLFLAIILVSIFALIGSVFSSTYNSRLYLIQQLQLKNQDNANALAISLSQSENDLVKIKLAVSAQFDTGNYEKVWFEDNKGEIVIEKSSLEAIKTIPNWFIHSISLDVPVGQAKVTSGWKQLGTVYLVSQKQYAYEALWKSTIESIWVSFFSIAVGIALAGMILNRFKGPLERLVDQVKNLPDRQFNEAPYSDVVELRGLNEAMNSSARRLKTLFEDEEKNIEELTQKLNHDELTGLMNRSFVLLKFKENLNNDSIKYNGCAIFRLLDLAKINQQRGRPFGDLLLKIVADQLNEVSSIERLGFVGRLSSSDFLMVFASEDMTKYIETFSERLLTKLGSHFDASGSLAIGLSDIHQYEKVSEVLSRLDIALAHSESAGNNSLILKNKKLFQEGHEYSDNIKGYFDLINQSLEDGKFRLLSHPLNSLSWDLIHFEAPLQIALADGTFLSAGKFLPIASRMGISKKLDLVGLKLAIDMLRKDSNLKGLAINFSQATLLDASLMNTIKTEMGQQSLRGRLWIDVPEFIVSQQPSLIAELTAYLRTLDVRVGIKHFSDRLYQVSAFKDLGVDYIKVDSSFIRELTDQPLAKEMLKQLTDLAHQVNLMVFAEGVETETEIGILKMLNFDGMTGKGINSFNN